MGDRTIRIRGVIGNAHVRQAVGNVWSNYEVFYSFYFIISDKREVISTEERRQSTSLVWANLDVERTEENPRVGR